ncbi:MAG: carbohydrate-binding protein [Saprospiraceae bacterium]|nr:carbohydrate-binding protein [Saprospiraceae bacterium]
MSIKHAILLSTCLFFLSFTISAQGFLTTNGKHIVNESGDTIILKGMGLGGWMLQEGYMLQTASFANPQHQIREKIEELIGKEDTHEFYEAWLANHVRKIDIDSLKSWGFNSVRLPMHYNLFTLPIEDEPVPGQHTWLEKGFTLTDSLISWCRQNEMYIVLDLHAAPGGQGNDQGISDRDEDKPSLWDSEANQDKTVALWQRIATRYVDEPWIAGYDLINETNWAMEGNLPLRNLYQEITDSIRTVDTKHMLFIEGNWFANDFTGLTPPWDDNMVYSPHKYWSFNDQASIQWVLDLREQYDIPIYFGETGENSNTWFKDAIRLFDEHQLGWAWWPMKKVESIAGPLSWTKTPEYQALLDYWNNGGNVPNADFAKATLMEMAEGFKLENCVYQKDVIDAMFRQQNSSVAIPFRIQEIPGVVFATDFDLGGAGVAYADSDIANYQVSTGNFTAWNNGWSYRNDGVDIERTQDNINSNGFNVGWIAPDEWMQYSLDVEEGGVYEIKVRVAANEEGGAFYFSTNDATLTASVTVSNTGGWQNWQTISITDVVLEENDDKLRFHAKAGGFNLNSFEFVRKGNSESIPASYVAGITQDEQHIAISVNKSLGGVEAASRSDFQITADGNPLTITDVALHPSNPRIIILGIDHIIKSRETLRASYTGNAIAAADGTNLESFFQEQITNTIATIHNIPGRIEAEDYFFQSGVQLENTSDAGGGQNIGFLDNGDYLDYYIDVATAGSYQVSFRTAALSEQGQVQLQLVQEDGNATPLVTSTFPATGGWQTWNTSNQNLDLPVGRHQLRMLITQPLFNINWLEFTLLTSTENPGPFIRTQLFPNPSNGLLQLKAELSEQQDVGLHIHNSLGQLLFSKEFQGQSSLDHELDLSNWLDGYYYLSLRSSDGSSIRRKLVKTSSQ